MAKIKLYDPDHHQDTNNLLLFLISLLGIIVFPAFGILLGEYTQTFFKISFSIVIIMGTYIVTNSKKHLRIGIILGLVFLFFLWGERLSVIFPFLELVVSILFFGFVAHQIKNLLSRNSSITVNAIYGAVIGYLLIGIIGGQLCLMVDLIQPGSFKMSLPDSRFTYFYYSFVCLTTLGFGDIIPNNDAAGAVSILIAITGQIYLTILIAIIVGKYLGQAQAETKNKK